MLKFNMLLLDITTGMFQIAIVFVVFYLIGEAVGSNVSGAVRDSQSLGSRSTSNIGNTFGSGLNKNMRWAIIGQRDKQGKIVSGGYGTKIGRGIRGGINIINIIIIRK